MIGTWGGAGWWATPAQPERWFTSERLAASRAYHAPLTTAAVLRGVGHLTGLLAVFAVADRFARTEIVSAGGFGMALWVGVVTGLVFATVNGITDTWMEYRHEPRFGSVPLPARRFASVAFASVLVAMVASAFGAAVLHLTARSTDWWPVVAVVVLVSVSGVVGPVSARVLHHHRPLDRETIDELDLVAASVGVDNVQWGQLVSPRMPGGSGWAEAGLNAVTLGFGGSRTILLTSELLAADASLRDFVVAHEASHLRRRHHQRSFAAAALGSACAVGCLWLVDRSFWSETGGMVEDPAAWPVVVIVLGLSSLPVGTAEAWLSRLHERQADADAAEAVGSPGASDLRPLHDHDRSDLSPGLFARCWSPHPTPAERLTAAERSARSG